jgi:dTDP-4-amino-4,6-dideoxygalactose transaminase
MIQYGRHYVDETDIHEVTAALRSDWLTTGPLVEKFEKALECEVGSPTIVVSSGTAALHCAYAAIQLKPGDEIITPPITFVATQSTAINLGGKIVFADVLHDTLTIDPDSVESVITPKTKAIVVVDYAGHPGEIVKLRALADRYKLYLIEDAAHSLGSKLNNKPVGSLADLTTFSFFPTKNIATGEGGAVSSPNPELLKRAKLFGRQGLLRDSADFKSTQEGPWHQEVQDFGLNYRLPDILCALGINQLKRIASFKRRRQEIFDFYKESLSPNPRIVIPTQRDGVDPMWHLFPIRVPSKIRLPLFLHLRNSGIQVQVNYMPAYRHPAFGYGDSEYKKYPVAESFYKETISLPIHVSLSDGDVKFIISKIQEVLN